MCTAASGYSSSAKHISPVLSTDTVGRDTTKQGVDSLSRMDSTDSLISLDSTDSLRIFDSLGMDTLKPKEPRKASLDAPIHIKFADSLVYEPASKDFFIHKSGSVDYEGRILQADYMRLNTSTKNVDARGIMDTTTQKMSRTQFTDAGKTYEMDSISYNMDSQKAMIHGTNTKEGEGFLYGGRAKKMPDNVIHMQNGRYTTCDATCPHFYLNMTKGTVKPGKNTVFGPSYMVFEDVPIYFLGLPFGFMPQRQERNSGFIFPTIGEERAKGFFIRDGGYYFAISDYVDLKLTAGWYTLGSWQAAAQSSYNKRYTFSGNIGLSYAYDKVGESGAPGSIETSGFNIRWTHMQDPKFRPNSTFSASVNFVSNNSYNKYNSNNLNDYLNSQTSSSIAYSKNWAGTPFSISMNASHNQNTKDSILSMSLPTVVFNVSRINPFKRKDGVGKERWYEKISFTYTMDFQNRVDNLKDKYFFKKEMFDKIQTGFQHNIPISASFNAFGALSITPSVSYRERWYFRAMNKTWDNEREQVITDTTNGFYRVFNYSASLSMNTKLYGTYTLGTKKPVIIRHVFTPRISGSYSPDFSAPGYGFWKTVQTSADGKTQKYSPYQNEIFGVPGQGSTASLLFGVDNTLEAKVPSTKDSTGYRKIKLIESFSISSSYNFLADSLNLAPFSVSLRIPIVKQYTLQLSASLDPYMVENGRRINKFLVGNGGFLRLTSLSTSFGFSFPTGNNRNPGTPAVNNGTNNNNGQMFNETLAAKNFFEQDDKNAQRAMIERARLAAAQYYDFSIPWNVNLNYTFNYNNQTGTPSITQSVNATASVTLTPKWAVSMSGGYDIQQGKLTPGTVQITRDLHCWQMSFSWVPVGLRQSWSFTIQAKSSMLADMLKWEKNNSFWDNYYY